jgi:hypothetical protein
MKDIINVGHKTSGDNSPINGDIRLGEDESGNKKPTEETNKSGESNKTANRKETVFFWISGASILFSIIALCASFVSNRMIISSESVVLFFIGVIATFIVVGNYAQVKDIESRFSERSGELEDGYKAKVGEISQIKDEILSIKEDIYKTKKQLYEQMRLFVDYRDYDELRRVAEEAFEKNEYTKALVKALQSAAIYPEKNLGGVKVEKNKDSDEIMSFYSNFLSYAMAMYYAIKDCDYIDFNKKDIETIRERSIYIYKSRGEQMPASMDKLIALMENRLSEKK